MDTYIKEMSFNEPESAELTFKAIERLIEKKIAEAGFSKIVDGIVVSPDVGGTYTIRLQDSTNNIPGAIATNGLVLVANDTIHVEFKNNGSKYYIKDKIGHITT